MGWSLAWRVSAPRRYAISPCGSTISSEEITVVVKVLVLMLLTRPGIGVLTAAKLPLVRPPTSPGSATRTPTPATTAPPRCRCGQVTGHATGCSPYRQPATELRHPSNRRDPGPLSSRGSRLSSNDALPAATHRARPGERSSDGSPTSSTATCSTTHRSSRHIPQRWPLDIGASDNHGSPRPLTAGRRTPSTSASNPRRLLPPARGVQPESTSPARTQRRAPHQLYSSQKRAHRTTPRSPATRSAIPARRVASVSVTSYSGCGYLLRGCRSVPAALEGRVVRHLVARPSTGASIDLDDGGRKRRPAPGRTAPATARTTRPLWLLGTLVAIRGDQLTTRLTTSCAFEHRGSRAATVRTREGTGRWRCMRCGLPEVRQLAM